ncbi:MAG: ATP synthase F1 subunit delta [Gemmatimonadetes bacterium]|nr:ATP synthase F1 subunit delta [Gemmatimonadota bacterium]
MGGSRPRRGRPSDPREARSGKRSAARGRLPRRAREAGQRRRPGQARVRDETVARNYAQTLFQLAQRHDGVKGYQEGMETVARLLYENPSFAAFLQTPRIALEAKKAVVKKAFGAVLPKPLLNFLLVVLDKRRQRLLREIAREYHDLVDAHMNRVHADVTVARPLDEEALKAVTERLTQLLGRTAIPHVRVKPEILGGIVVQTGDTIYDGSLRRRLEGMRRQLLGAQLRTSGAGTPS